MKCEGGSITCAARSDDTERAKKQEVKTKKKANKSGHKDKKDKVVCKCRRIYPDLDGPIDFVENDEPFAIADDPERELTGQPQSFGSPDPLPREWEESIPSNYAERLLLI